MSLFYQTINERRLHNHTQTYRDTYTPPDMQTYIDIRRLQSIQNAAARLLTGTRRRDHISPVLSRLHWLPVKQRVVIILATIVFQSLRGETTSYLADDCQLIADSGLRCLRSADANAFTVPRTNTRLGDRSFSVAGPKVWNSLPATQRQPDVELGQFKRLLKTFLFCEAAAH